MIAALPAEVVAADVRPVVDGPKVALIRLMAGSLGVGFDDLRRRELQRRNRRLTLIAAGSWAGMALTFTLAVGARRARGEAVLARSEAQRQQEQAVTAERIAAREAERANSEAAARWPRAQAHHERSRQKLSVSGMNRITPPGHVSAGGSTS